MKTSRQKFRCSDDPDARISEVDSVLLRPEKPVALLVLGHGAGAGMDHDNMLQIAAAMAGQQIASFRYNFPFIHRGGGRDSRDVTVATIRRAAGTARRLLPGVPMLAGGHSFGGRLTTVAQALSPLDHVQGIVCCSFPLHMPEKVSDKRIEHFPDIKVPCLFLSGERDKMMTFDLFEPAIQKMKAGNRKLARLHRIHTASHGYQILKRTRVSAESVFEEMARVTREWFDSRFVSTPRRKK